MDMERLYMQIDLGNVAVHTRKVDILMLAAVLTSKTQATAGAES